MRRLKKRINEEKGASLVEYALLVALISVVSIGALQEFRSSLVNNINGSSAAIKAAGSTTFVPGG